MHMHMYVICILWDYFFLQSKFPFTLNIVVSLNSTTFSLYFMVVFVCFMISSLFHSHSHSLFHITEPCTDKTATLLQPKEIRKEFNLISFYLTIEKENKKD